MEGSSVASPRPRGRIEEDLMACKCKKSATNAAKLSEWNALSEQQRGAVILAGVAQVALMLFAQGNLLGSPRERVRGPKWAWFFGNLVNFVGPIAYFLFGRKKAREPYLLMAE